MRDKIIAITLFLPIILFGAYKFIGPYQMSEEELLLVWQSDQQFQLQITEGLYTNTRILDNIKNELEDYGRPADLIPIFEKAERTRKVFYELNIAIKDLREKMIFFKNEYGYDIDRPEDLGTSITFKREALDNLTESINDFKTKISEILGVRSFEESINNELKYLLADINDNMPRALCLYQLSNFELRLVKFEKAIQEKHRKQQKAAINQKFGYLPF